MLDGRRKPKPIAAFSLISHSSSSSQANTAKKPWKSYKSKHQLTKFQYTSSSLMLLPYIFRALIHIVRLP
jgi:hypothetical protein